MNELLIHSMSEFSDIIVDAMDIANVSRIAEIGAEFGGMSKVLADHAAVRGGHLYSIDPMPKPEFLGWASDHKHVTHIPKLSLDAFADLEDIDLCVIDGDHNWYSVYHELHELDKIFQRDQKPYFAILHDVCWPSGQRDQYYNPDVIPEKYRHDFCMHSGTIPGYPGLVSERGFRGMGQFGFALHEGGERNGVKCAVVDFLNEMEKGGQELAYAEIPAVFGLGIIFDAKADWAEALGEYLVPLHANPLIAKLEQNRIANYLTVLDWQDGHIS
jgi:Methyltransferase domain